MGHINPNESSIEGDVYIQRLAAYIKKNEESLANGLLLFSKSRSSNKVKPSRLNFTIHHLYYVTERIDSSSLGVGVGPLNVKLDSPNHEPTFISFMANNARSSRNFDSDAKSISSMNSVRSIVSSASMYWRTLGFSKDPQTLDKDIKYLYSSFTKIPCLTITPKTAVSTIASYEEYPCDTAVPLKMFKNLQVLEINNYDPNEIFGWNSLSEQLRILIIKNSKLNSLQTLLFNLVIDDGTGRAIFNSHKHSRKHTEIIDFGAGDHFLYDLQDYSQYKNTAFKYPKNDKASSAGTGSSWNESLSNNENIVTSKEYKSIDARKWSELKQLTVMETSITSIPAFVFKPLSSLVKLNLSKNLLEDVPQGLEQLTYIKYLNLSDNFIVSLKNLPQNLKYLTVINLKNNKLENLEGIENVKALAKVDLRKNKLNTIAKLRPLFYSFRDYGNLGNIYISGNNLPKNYRIEVFNLFNGIRPMSTIKLDDSRPGYFESALLLDSESSVRHWERFNKTGSTREEKRKTRSSIEHSESVTSRLSALTLVEGEDVALPSPINRFNLAHNVAVTSPVTGDVPTVNNTKSPSSPLNANQNLSNISGSSIPGKHQTSRLSLALGSTINASISTSSMKRSSTLAQLELNSAMANSTATSIITPVQVTARMGS